VSTALFVPSPSLWLQFVPHLPDVGLACRFRFAAYLVFISRRSIDAMQEMREPKSLPSEEFHPSVLRDGNGMAGFVPFALHARNDRASSFNICSDGGSQVNGDNYENCTFHINLGGSNSPESSTIPPAPAAAPVASQKYCLCLCFVVPLLVLITCLILYNTRVGLATCKSTLLIRDW
jgi:hypothetical protein